MIGEYIGALSWLGGGDGGRWKSRAQVSSDVFLVYPEIDQSGFFGVHVFVCFLVIEAQFGLIPKATTLQAAISPFVRNFPSGKMSSLSQPFS